jgi:hypothetical protein
MGRYTVQTPNGPKRSPIVRQIHAILHKALEQAIRFGLISTNPASRVDPPKVRQEEITPLTAEQASKRQQLLDRVPGGSLFGGIWLV